MLEELRVSDVDGLLLQIDIPELQARDLSTAQAGAVGEHQHREQPDRTPGSFRRRVHERCLQYPLYLLIRVEVGRAVIPASCSIHTIPNRQTRHPWTEP